jgi:hypothetical protein
MASSDNSSNPITGVIITNELARRPPGQPD